MTRVPRQPEEHARTRAQSLSEHRVHHMEKSSSTPESDSNSTPTESDSSSSTILDGKQPSGMWYAADSSAVLTDSSIVPTEQQ